MKKFPIHAHQSAVAAMQMAGCMKPERTSIKFNPRTREVSVLSGKDVAIKSVSVRTETNGTYEMKVEGYTATNNVEVIKSIARANAATMEALATTGKKVLEDTIDLAK